MNLNAITASDPKITASPNEAKLMRDDFLKLLVAQMENQDPLDPLDNAEFTAQLAQFSSLEQLLDVNKNLTGFQSLQETLNRNESLNYLGREVTSMGNEISLRGGSVDFSYELAGSADEVHIGIYNSSGELVRKDILNNKAGGEHAYTWDGRDNNGIPLPSGNYRLQLLASAGDSDIKVTTYTTGKVDAISYENGDTVLSVGGVKVGQADIRAIK